MMGATWLAKVIGTSGAVLLLLLVLHEVVSPMVNARLTIKM
jgi:hypothetical protein